MGNANFNVSNINMVANYYKPSSATENAVRSRILNPTTRNGDADYGHFYQDSDKDGMPDDWENANGLNPSDASDRNKMDGVGYTMLEKYLNSLI